ncbi:molybdopterin molybdotransferase MoeA [Mesorhizobium xinjiangense]|uniref:molybdopterin molybdotransferase MoeA n=1 Tax=Mesorhizobium xinjiangense TaxID=2678685 RepID=UPI0012ED2F44|nr:gephyrin-like molybdotransferase Glp [Mesorhizobium xinjiangense]
MAQLSDDCFAFGGPLMPVDDAVGLIRDRLDAVEETESVSLAVADGRVLAADIVAPIALPPYTNSAVDGYALAGDDVPYGSAQPFAVSGRLQAGASEEVRIKAGETVRIFTGAPMPEGADTVFMQEDVENLDDGRVLLPAGLKRGANVRPAGEDVEAGHTVLPAGRRLRPQDVAMAAALGLSALDVRRPVKVGLFSTGNEVVEPGAARGRAQLFDSNRYMLAAMLRRLGCAVEDFGILRDDKARIAGALEDAAGNCDLILASGGVSTGEADHVRAGVESAGSLVFWRVAIKPGRPVAMGVVKGTPFIGLPGNPVASFVTFAHVARAAVTALSGAREEPALFTPLPAAFSYRKKPGRREYVRAGLRRGQDGHVAAVKYPKEGAGLISSLVDTDGLVELAEDTLEVRPGDRVRFIPYSSLF